MSVIYLSSKEKVRLSKCYSLLKITTARKRGNKLSDHFSQQQNDISQYDFSTNSAAICSPCIRNNSPNKSSSAETHSRINKRGESSCEISRRLQPRKIVQQRSRRYPFTRIDRIDDTRIPLSLPFPPPPSLSLSVSRARARDDNAERARVLNVGRTLVNRVAKGSTKFQLRHGRLAATTAETTIDSHLSTSATTRARGPAMLLARLILCCAPGLAFAVVSDTPSVIYHEKLPLTSRPSRPSTFFR